MRDIPDELIEQRPSTSYARIGSGGFYPSQNFSRRGFGDKPVGKSPPIFSRGGGSSSQNNFDGGFNLRAKKSSGSGELTFEPDAGANEPRYRKGERVFHNTFGSGTITAVESAMGDAKLTVRFDNGVSKKLMARFAKLARE